MANLQVEALESRRLLNGHFGAVSLMPLPPFPTGTFIVWMTERLPLGEHGGWFGEGAIAAGRMRSFAWNDFDGGGRDMYVPQSVGRPDPADDPPPEIWGYLGRVGANNPGGDPDGTTGRGTVPNNFLALTATSPAAPAASAPSSASGATIPGILLQRINPQPVPAPETPIDSHSLTSDLQGLFALRSPVQLPHVGEGPQRYSGSSETSHQTSRTSAAAPAAQEPVLPSAKGADLLAVLPLFDDSGLDVGFQQFLEQLERLCPRLTNDAESSALWPWIVAVTAAATAGEIARRELRRPAVLSAGEGHESGGFPSDQLFMG